MTRSERSDGYCGAENKTNQTASRSRAYSLFRTKEPVERADPAFETRLLGQGEKPGVLDETRILFVVTI